jgi:hypothetical protein
MLKYGVLHYSIETKYDRLEKECLGQREARLPTVLLPKDAYKTAERLGAVVLVWSPRDRIVFNSFLQDLSRNLDRISRLEHRISDTALTELQVFLNWVQLSIAPSYLGSQSPLETRSIRLLGIL